MFMSKKPYPMQFELNEGMKYQTISFGMPTIECLLNVKFFFRL